MANENSGRYILLSFLAVIILIVLIIKLYSVITKTDVAYMTYMSWSLVGGALAFAGASFYFSNTSSPMTPLAEEIYVGKFPE
jgi:pheromone shutdown protein TraB